jgi:hypothetical protein
MTNKFFFRTQYRMYCLLVLALVSIASCSKMDDYKEKYLAGGEIYYTGKIDSLKISSGRNRVLVTGLFIADPKVQSCRIYWDSRTDSAVIPVTRTANVDTLTYIVEGLTEGSHTFEIVTFDALGNRSVIVYGSGDVYGDRYQSSLINRPILGSELDDNANTTIEWGDLDITSGARGAFQTYTDVNDKSQTVYVAVEDASTVLPNYKYGTTFNYKTMYLPDSTCIDTFYAPSQIVDVKTNVTAIYIKNAGNPFLRSTWDGGRWGILADWITSNDVKNANGYGGYELRSNVGVLSMEGGWGLPAVPNGKIYQVLDLPAGQYSFQAIISANGSTGTKYLAVAVGDEMPNYATITQDALAYTNLSNGTLNFELTEPTKVCLGFVSNLDNSGQYYKVSAVKLKYLKM